MSRHDASLTLEQIRQFVTESIEIAAGKNREDLDSHRLLELALVRLIEMIGEASNRLPEEIREQYPGIPWRNIIATRNRLIHGYDSINKDILWSIIQNDLPKMLQELNSQKS